MKRLFFGVAEISQAAYDMLTGTLRLCCSMLFCSLLLLVHTSGLAVHTYALYRLAAELQSSSGALLLLGNVAALLLELCHRKG